MYVRTDTLDLNSTSCLTIIEQITWFPRQPTSYFVNVFTVEDKIIPELEDLRLLITEEVLDDASTIAEDNDLAPSPPPSPPPSDASIAEDNQLASAGVTSDVIKEIWIHREHAIEDWENSFSWASPDFNPASATDEALKATAYDDAETELQSSPYMPLTSTESVFSKAFTGQDTQIDPDEIDNDFKDNAWGDDLETEWNELPNKLSGYGMLHDFADDHSIFHHDDERGKFEKLVDISLPASKDWL